MIWEIVKFYALNAIATQGLPVGIKSHRGQLRRWKRNTLERFASLVTVSFGNLFTYKKLIA